VQFVNEVADDLGSNRFAGNLDGMDEIADQVTGRNWVAGDDVFVNEVADDLGSNRFAGSLDGMDEIANEVTEILHVKILSNLRVGCTRSVVVHQ